MYISTKPLILASASPRRKQFLKDLGLSFTSLAADIDESRGRGEKAEDYVSRLAAEKGQQISQRQPEAWVISADTIVCLGQEVYGKPGNVDEALAVLMTLAGKTHQVMTSFCIRHENDRFLALETVITKVRFWPFPPELAKNYVASGEPFDKAGGYGIQGKGAQLVAAIEGSYTNVVGLPLSELVKALLTASAIRPLSG